MGRVVALVDDLFFQTRIAETGRQVGVDLKTVKTGEELLTELARADASLIIVDLNARNGPLEAIEMMRDRASQVPVVAFLSHVQTELAERARAAGCTQVLPRSKFTQHLATLLTQAKTGQSV